MNNNNTTAQVVKRQAKQISNLQSVIRSLQEQLEIEKQLHQLTKQDLEQIQEKFKDINNPQKIVQTQEKIIINWHQTAYFLSQITINCQSHNDSRYYYE
jgi:septation ring formation regulator EzrA